MILWLKGLYETTDDLEFVGHCDLYFMLQWFCFISPIPLGIYISYLGWWVTVILQMTSYYRQVRLTYISSLSDFSLNLPHYLMYIHHALVNRSLWNKEVYRSLWNNEQPQTICRTLWPIFHSPVILLNISNTISHNYILGLMGHCDTTNHLIL